MRSSLAFGWAVGGWIALLAGSLAVHLIANPTAQRVGERLVTRRHVRASRARVLFVAATVAVDALSGCVVTGVLSGWSGAAAATLATSIALTGLHPRHLGSMGIVVSGQVAVLTTGRGDEPRAAMLASAASLVGVVLIGLGGDERSWLARRRSWWHTVTSVRATRVEIARVLDRDILADADLAWWAAHVGHDGDLVTLRVPGSCGRLTGTVRADGAQLLVLLTPAGRVAGTSVLLQPDRAGRDDLR